MNTDLIVATNSLRDVLRPRRLIPALLLILLPAAIGLYSKQATASGWNPDATYDGLTVTFVYGFTLTILSVVYGTGVIAQELEQRTIVYLLTRPIPRWRLLLAKTVASVAVVAAISILSDLLLALVVYGPAAVSQAGVGLDIVAILIGASAYGCFFVMLGALLPKPLIYGLLFVFGWETWVPFLPGSFPMMSIMTFLRVVARREVNDNGASNSGGLLTLFSVVHPDISRPLAWTVLLAIAIVSLVLSMVSFSTREYIPREEAD